MVVEFVEESSAGRRIDIGEKKDKVGVQEFLEFRIGEELLTQQSAAPSASRMKIDEDEFVLGLGLGHGLIKSALEPVLSPGGGGKEKPDGQSERFFHAESPSLKTKQSLQPLTFINTDHVRKRLAL